MLTLLLSRHGTTLANEEGRWIGRKESPISKKGQEEILQLKEKLKPYKIDGIYTSPSLRTLETVEQVVDREIRSRLVYPVEALREIDFGLFEEKNFKWAKQHYPQEVQKMIEEKEAYTYPEGESLLIMHQRIANWLRWFKRQHTQGTYFICAHGGTIRSILSELLIGSYDLHWHFKIGHGTLTVVTIDEDFAVIESLNG